MSNTHKGIKVTFVDDYGRERVIHAGKNGLKLQRLRVTPVLALNQAIGQMVGQRVKAWRQKRQMSQTELCFRAGIVSATPKQRMYEIESGSRKEGIRLGTLYALANALDLKVEALLPTVQEALEGAKLDFGIINEPTLQMREKAPAS